MTCRCGHPQHRHLFHAGNCLHASKTEGGAARYCQCKVFEPPPVIPDPTMPANRWPRKHPDYDLGTMEGAE